MQSVLLLTLVGISQLRLSSFTVVLNASLCSSQLVHSPRFFQKLFPFRRLFTCHTVASLASTRLLCPCFSCESHFSVYGFINLRIAKDGLRCNSHGFRMRILEGLQFLWTRTISVRSVAAASRSASLSERSSSSSSALRSRPLQALSGLSPGQSSLPPQALLLGTIFVPPGHDIACFILSP